MSDDFQSSLANEMKTVGEDLRYGRKYEGADFHDFDTEFMSEPEPPVILRRTDDVGLICRGRLNELHGPRESGKTLITEAAMAEWILSGLANGWPRWAMFIDLDRNGPSATGSRLEMFGVPRAVLADRERFAYIQPSTRAEIMYAFSRAADPPWGYPSDGFTVVDSNGELISALSGDENNAGHYHGIVRNLFDPVLKDEGTLALIDHPTKNGDAHDSGGTRAKAQVINGTSLQVQPVRQFTPGRGGAARILVSKDRDGGLRSRCPEGRGAGRWPVAGIFELDPTGAWRITPEKDGTATGSEDDDLAVAMLELGEFGVVELAAATGVSDNTARRRIDEMVERGVIRMVREGGRGRGRTALWTAVK